MRERGGKRGEGRDEAKIPSFQSRPFPWFSHGSGLLPALRSLASCGETKSKRFNEDFKSLHIPIDFQTFFAF